MSGATETPLVTHEALRGALSNLLYEDSDKPEGERLRDRIKAGAILDALNNIASEECSDISDASRGHTAGWLVERARQEAAMLREIANSEARGIDWQVNLNATADFLAGLRAILDKANPCEENGRHYLTERADDTIKELLEALDGLLRMTDFEQSEPWIVKAHAAIAKARPTPPAGETPEPEQYDDRPEWEMRTGFREEDFG